MVHAPVYGLAGPGQGLLVLLTAIRQVACVFAECLRLKTGCLRVVLCDCAHKQQCNSVVHRLVACPGHTVS